MIKAHMCGTIKKFNWVTLQF